MLNGKSSNKSAVCFYCGTCNDKVTKCTRSDCGRRACEDCLENSVCFACSCYPPPMEPTATVESKSNDNEPIVATFAPAHEAAASSLSHLHFDIEHHLYERTVTSPATVSQADVAAFGRECMRYESERAASAPDNLHASTEEKKCASSGGQQCSIMAVSLKEMTSFLDTAPTFQQLQQKWIPSTLNVEPPRQWLFCLDTGCELQDIENRSDLMSQLTPRRQNRIALVERRRQVPPAPMSLRIFLLQTALPGFDLSAPLDLWICGLNDKTPAICLDSRLSEWEQNDLDDGSVAFTFCFQLDLHKNFEQVKVTDYYIGVYGDPIGIGPSTRVVIQDVQENMTIKEIDVRVPSSSGMQKFASLVAWIHGENMPGSFGKMRGKECMWNTYVLDRRSAPTEHGYPNQTCTAVSPCSLSYKCPVCSKRFHSLEELQGHLAPKKPDLTLADCSRCIKKHIIPGRTPSEAADLAYHYLSNGCRTLCVQTLALLMNPKQKKTRATHTQ